MSKLENEFAKSLKDSGLKFERNCRDLPGTPDVVFREQKLAVFFHGCFWHSHHCQKQPKSDEWTENLNNIKANDKSVLHQLRTSGFQSLIVWECDWLNEPKAAIKLIENRLFFLQFQK